MTRKIFSKVVWVGRTAATAFGVALVMALVFGVATTAIGATGGNFILGKANSAGALSKLTANVAGPALQLVNNGTGAAATALNLTVASGKPPLTVNPAAGKATNLNADEIDGLDSSELAPRGYAHVTPAGNLDTAYPSKGVNGVMIAQEETSVYCFDLAFTPDAAVGSPFFLNNATVATVTPPNAALSSTCEAPHQDAAVQTFAANTSEDAPINFQVVFE